MGVRLTKEMIEGAKYTEEMYGVPSSVTLAQIILESGGSYDGGLSGLAYNYNNLFGVTAGSSWNGETITLSNKAGNDTQTYRVYDSITESIIDHAIVLNKDRYTQYTSKAKNVNEYVVGIAKGGYATDPNYSDKVLNVISKNNLTAYDGVSWVGKSGNIIPTMSMDAPTEGSDKVKDFLNDATAELQGNENGTNLKWWGDLIVVILCVLLIGLGIIFFLSAFNGISKPPFFNKLNKFKKVVE